MKELLAILHRLLLFRRLTLTELHLLGMFMVIGFPVVVDLVNGFLIQVIHSNFSLGVLYRGLILIVLVPFLLLVREFWVKIFLVLAVGSWLLANAFWVEIGHEYSPLYEVNIFSKLIYAWILYGYLSYATRVCRIPIEYPMKFLMFFGVVVGVSILFSYFTGYGISTYHRASTYAVKSFFKSQNEIGLTTLISLVFCMYFFARYGRWLYGIYAVIILAGLVLLGTRAGILGGFVTFGTFTMLFLLRTLKSRRHSPKQGLLVGFMLLSIVVGIVYTITLTSAHRYLMDKYASLLEGSPRETLELAAERRLDERGPLISLLGEGDSSFRVGVLKYFLNKEKSLTLVVDDNDTGKSVEQDIYDLVGAYGLLIGGGILLFLLLLFFRATLGFLVSWRLLDFTFVMAFALFLTHAFLAGHALRSAVVASAAAVIYLYAIDLARPMFKRSRFAGYTQADAV